MTVNVLKNSNTNKTLKTFNKAKVSFGKMKKEKKFSV